MQQPLFSYRIAQPDGYRPWDHSNPNPMFSNAADDESNGLLNRMWWRSFGTAYTDGFKDIDGHAVSLSYHKDTNGKRFFWVLRWTKQDDQTFRLRDGWCFNNYESRAVELFNSLRPEEG